MLIGVRAHLNGIAWSSEFRTVVQRLVPVASGLGDLTSLYLTIYLEELKAKHTNTSKQKETWTKIDRKPENLQKKIQRPKNCINIMMPGHSCNVFLRWPPSVVLLVLSTFPHWWFLLPMLIAQMSSDWVAFGGGDSAWTCCFVAASHTNTDWHAHKICENFQIVWRGALAKENNS